VLLVAIGGCIILAYWLPQAFLRSLPSSAPLIMVFGMLCYQFLPSMPQPFDPIASPVIWEMTSEIVVIVVLFATGLRIDRIPDWRNWLPTVRLLANAMPLTIAAVAILGWALAGMTIAGAVTLGAVLAPTDPVLAGDVQVGPPSKGMEHPLRFTLTTEAGLNDGFAFPFVYLGLAIATQGTNPSSWFTDWLAFDVVYRIIVGTAAGCGLGWLLGKVNFSTEGGRTLAKTGPGVIALAGTLLCYGLVELIQGYGFLAVFFAGLFYRRHDEAHEFHGRMHIFSESIEQALTAFLLFALGSAMPALWPYFDWRHTVIGFGLIFAIRPLASLLSLIGSGIPMPERYAVSFLGVRGIGSIYYMAYAASHIDFINKEELWALVAYTIFASAVIHGASAKLIVRYATGGR
jgi:sodium/hydrogen antiporter